MLMHKLFNFQKCLHSPNNKLKLTHTSATEFTLIHTYYEEEEKNFH